jgi:hypothetical protein
VDLSDDRKLQTNLERSASNELKILTKENNQLEMRIICRNGGTKSWSLSARKFSKWRTTTIQNSIFHQSSNHINQKCEFHNETIRT